jgi:hypothetical protein
MIKLKKGANRWVVLVSNIAIKFPACYSYRSFLEGLLSNFFELRRYQRKRGYGEYPPSKLCPIIFHFPLGVIIVMKRAKVLTESEFQHFNYQEFCETGMSCFIENKPDSFGILNEKIVVVDYG